MRVGKSSPIVQAIHEVHGHTGAVIRVHLTQRWFEPNPMKRAWKLFHRFELHHPSIKNGILIYVNLNRKKFAIYGNESVHAKLGQTVWDQLARKFSQDLRSTHYENAIAQGVRRVGEVLATYFPK